MGINQINLPFVLMDIVKHYMQIEAKKKEIKILATTFDGLTHTLSLLKHTQKNPNGYYVINEIKMRLNFQQFNIST